MTPADDYILEFLEESGIAANPTTIGFNIDYKNTYVSERGRKLEDNGLLVRVDESKAMYEITGLGQQYLNEELSKEELERLDEE